MIREFFRFELREQLRTPLLWLLSALFGLLAFGAISSDAVQIGGGIGNVHRNAPTVIVQFTTVFTLLGILISAALFSNAMLRDFELGTADVLFSNPIKKRDFLIGRFSAAFVATLLIYVVIGFAMMIAQFMPWIDEKRLGEFSLTPFVWSFVVYVIPNAVFTSALLTFLAVTTRSILWVYIGVIGFMVAYFVSAALLSNLDNVWLATLLEPLGIRAFGRTVRYWSTTERNLNLPEVVGYIGANRALWMGLGLAIIAATFRSFKTERAGTTKAWSLFKRKSNAGVPAVAEANVPRLTSVQFPKVQPQYGFATTVRQWWQTLRFDAKGVFLSVPFLVLLFFGMANFIPSALLMQTMYETPVYPVTSQMVLTLEQSYSFLLVIIALFYAGELVWKERNARIHEVTDAMPVSNGVPLLAKFATLVAVVVAFQVLGAMVGVLIQLAKGHTQLEPMTYLKILSAGSIPYVLMGGMALVLQVFTNNKFAGYAFLIVLMLGQSVLGSLDLTHNLYNFGQWPNAPYSDMNGYGHFLQGQLAFQGYWLLLLIALLILSAALWVRGSDTNRKQRLAQLRERFRGGLGKAFAVATAAFVAWGGWLFWNTNVRNDFISPDSQLDLQARYEKEMKHLESTPQPRIVASTVHVDLFPETQTMRADVRYLVRNNHVAPIKTIHLTARDHKQLAEVNLGPAKLVRQIDDFEYRQYDLNAPLQPGEEREFQFTIDAHPNGITNSLAQTQFVENGSFFNSSLFPAFGYQTRAEIDDRNERRKRGLGEPRRMPKLEDEAARANTYIGNSADWIDFKTSVCTAPDQVALAPGYLKREYQKDGRRCFDYEMDRPMLNFYAYLSAKWSVKRGQYKNIPIEIYHDPKHSYNVDRMIAGVQKSLAYYEANFSPYQHKQVRIIEFPGYERFAQSFANTIPYSENIGFIADLRKVKNIDYVFYVTAHEIAHQWWAHQVIGANVQGATVLSESLSQYSALMVMEKEYGRAKMRRFLKYELDSYLGNRGSEQVEELPLYRVENQQHIHYRKGSLVFYRLREEMGEAALNRALQKFIADKAYQSAPFTTSKELLQYIRAEATPAQQTLITDLFEKISFYDNRVSEASAKKTADGNYTVTLKLHADKLYADGQGVETKGALDDWIDVAVFAKGKSGEEDDEVVLYFKRHHITKVDNEIIVTVNQKPDSAGFDPYNKLIDRVSADNRKKVSI